MSWLKELFSSSVGTVVEEVGEAIDSLVTNDEERLILRNKLVEIQAKSKQREIELKNKYEEELTKRNADDQKNGNFLTKSARPVFLYWIMCIITIIIFGGIGGIVINEAYINLIQVLSITAVTFFFGSKGLEAYKHGKIL